MNPIFFYETYKKYAMFLCHNQANRQTSYSLNLFLNFYRQI